MDWFQAEHWALDEELEAEQHLRHVFWTGGFDSTFRVLQLLEQGYAVQPIYIAQRLDGRANREHELETMERLMSLIRARYPDGELEDVLIVREVAVNVNVQRMAAKIGYGGPSRYRMGYQYVKLCEFAASYHAPIEIGVEIGGRAERLLRGMTRGEGAMCRIDPTQLIEPYQQALLMFEPLRFPLLHLTKSDMTAEAEQKGFLDILQQTWTCWYPRDGQPCGDCGMCRARPPEANLPAYEPLLISYYTDDLDYPERARRLRAQLEALGLPHRIEPRMSLGNRQQNCWQKVIYLYEQMQEHDRPLVWLDIDSDVVDGKNFRSFFRYCVPRWDFVARDKVHTPDQIYTRQSLQRKNTEIRASARAGTIRDARWSGGLMFFNTTPHGKRLLERAYALAHVGSNIYCYDEQIFTVALREVWDEDIRVRTLPSRFTVSKTYLWNEDRIPALRSRKLRWDSPRVVSRFRISKSAWDPTALFPPGIKQVPPYAITESEEAYIPTAQPSRRRSS